MKRKRPVDPYDGHRDYLRDSQDDLRRLPLQRFFDVAVSALAGWTLAYWVYLATWPVDPLLADFIVRGSCLVIVWFFGVLLFGTLLGRFSIMHREWWMLAAGCLITFSLGVLTPMVRFDRLRGEAEQARSQAEVRKTQLDREAQQKWIDDIYAAEAHGPIGTEPPMLHIEDAGLDVRVRNITDREIRCVYVDRGEAGTSPYCSLGACKRIEPGSTVTYSLPPDKADCAASPLAFRIGDYLDPEPTWWTDSELDSHVR